MLINIPASLVDESSNIADPTGMHAVFELMHAALTAAITAQARSIAPLPHSIAAMTQNADASCGIVAVRADFTPVRNAMTAVMA